MAAEPEQDPQRWEKQTENAHPAGDPYQEDSPDLLRWRADLLMDEMMLGAVDVSAGASERRSEPEPPVESREAEQPSPGDSSYLRSADGLSGTREGYDSYRSDSGGQTGEGGARHDTSVSPPHVENAADATTESYSDRFPHEVNRATDSSSGRPQDQDILSGSEPVFSEESNQFDAPARAGSVDGSMARSGGAEAETSTYKWDWQPPPLPKIESGGLDSTASTNSSEIWPGTTPPSAEDEQPHGDYASAMSLAVNGRKRSTLLPRMSSLDSDALDREIADLHAEIAIILPIGHETAERARHLLDKAHTILHSDPMRSAEVEYYMQQVRSIVQRVRQSHRWSDLYRDRLRLYLGAWVLLSLLVLVGCYLFQLQFEAFVMTITNATFDSMVVQHSIVLILSVFAGALGGASGALLTMQRHMRQEYGFFDRKYGLRGLMLPIIGAILGAIIYIVFGVVYRFAGINPSLNIIAATVPALAAFALGFSQESIYGIRE